MSETGRRDLAGELAKWLAGGPRQMGEVLIRAAVGGYELRHVADAGRADLRDEEPRQLALYSEAGAYRPLKTSPDLRRGWRVAAASAVEVRRALDLIYPAMLGVLLDFQRGLLPAVPLRATLDRQSGMYAVTRKLTDEQAQSLIAAVCRSDGGCLKTILWRISDAAPVASLPPSKFDPALNQASPALAPALPMLCQEGCNLLVARAREMVKSPEPPAAGSGFS